jgi:anion-transporting  ArsA/GET3 family ATPase
MDALLRDRAVLYVTGKGGVGKTTVAAALGLAAARTGRRTIVCEVAEQDRMSRAFRRHGVRPEQETQLAENLWAVTIDPEKALQEWLGKQLGGGAATRVLAHSHAFQYFVAAAPGAKELITIAKVWELAQSVRWTRDNRAYDLVVVDAPASGHGIGMLTTPQTFGEIARVGPIRRQANKVTELLRDPARTGYVAVALPEEMPVNETIELDARLRDAVGLGLDAVVVNALWPERLSAADVTRLHAVERDGHDAGSLGAVRSALAAHERVKAQRAHVRRLESALEAPVSTLPFVFESDLELEHYERLAEALG